MEPKAFTRKCSFSFLVVRCSKVYNKGQKMLKGIVVICFSGVGRESVGVPDLRAKIALPVELQSEQLLR